jgi:hypothetical protein
LNVSWSAQEEQEQELRSHVNLTFFDQVKVGRRQGRVARRRREKRSEKRKD